MRRSPLSALFLAAVCVLAACSSGKKATVQSAAKRGFRVLDAVVTARIYDPPGSPGTTIAGNGNWFLEFEAMDGDATAHYRFPVNRNQYNRYQEGQRVQLVMADDELREIRPVSN
jgi:hypothetical protein